MLMLKKTHLKSNQNVPLSLTSFQSILQSCYILHDSSNGGEILGERERAKFTGRQTKIKGGSISIPLTLPSRCELLWGENEVEEHGNWFDLLPWTNQARFFICGGILVVKVYKRELCLMMPLTCLKWSTVISLTFNLGWNRLKLYSTG